MLKYTFFLFGLKYFLTTVNSFKNVHQKYFYHLVEEYFMKITINKTKKTGIHPIITYLHIVNLILLKGRF